MTVAKDIDQGNKPVTQEEIARKAGVSRSIVSRVLSNAPHSNISATTRTRILDISRQLNYKLKTAVQRHHNIVVALYDVSHINRHYFSTIISGIAHQSGEFDFDLQFLSMRPEIKEKSPNQYFLNRPMNRNVKGYIIIDQAIPDEEILKIEQHDVPFVLINREIPGKDVPCVIADETKAMYDLASFLINKGYKDLSLLLTSRQFNRDARKLIGFEGALKDNGLNFEESMVHEIRNQNAIERINLIMSILNKEERPLGIITVHDDVAAHIMELAQKKGLRVPEDLAVTGYNDSPIASFYPTPITSIKPPLKEMGEKAIKLLENLIAGTEVKTKKVVLESQISIRSSC